MSSDLAPSSVSTSGYPGHLHQYAPGLTAFDGRPDLPNAVVWIGGLYAGLDVSGGSNLQALEEAVKGVGAGWSVVQSIRSSSYSGWGWGSIRKDAEEVGLLVEYLVKVAGKQKVVLVGHSTGTQDIITFAHLLATSSLPGFSPEAATHLAGYTLLAPASDRAFLEQVKSHDEIAKHLSPPEGKDWDDFIPPSASQDPFGPTRITYRRWRSLAGRPPSTEPGAKLDIDASEDFFSPDLPDHFLRGAVFADVDRPLQLLLNEEDETFAKDGGDLGAWLARLEGALPEGARSGKSGIVKGADHSVTSEAAQGELRRHLAGFLETL